MVAADHELIMEEAVQRDQLEFDKPDAESESEGSEDEDEDEPEMSDNDEFE